MAKTKTPTSPNLGNNLKFLMKREVSLSSQTQLAEKTGLSQSTIGRILRGEVNPSAVALQTIASKFNVEVGDLLLPTDEFYEKHASDKEKSQTQTLNWLSRFSDSITKGEVPLLTWRQAARNNGKAEPLFDLETEYPAVVCPVPHGLGTFALEIKSLNMHNPSGPISFQEGERIFVERQDQVKNKAFIVVCSMNQEEAQFRQLLIEGDRFFLQHLNPSWPERITPLTEQDIIIGVAIAKVQILQ